MSDLILTSQKLEEMEIQKENIGIICKQKD